jgi:hypothetical protein
MNDSVIAKLLKPALADFDAQAGGLLLQICFGVLVTLPADPRRNPAMSTRNG